MASSTEIGMDYYQKGFRSLTGDNVEDGIENLKMAEAIFAEEDDTEMYVKCLNGLCVGYSLIGHYAQMVSNVLKGIEFCDRNHLNGAKNIFYINICDRYMNLGDYDSAINYGLMAAQDVETENSSFEIKPQNSLVIYLNLSYSYMKTYRFNEAALYLQKAKTIAEKNDIKSHDLSIAIMDAYIHYQKGDSAFVEAQEDDLLNVVKNLNITIDDYIQDISLLTELFCKMGKFEDALRLAHSLDYSSGSSSNRKVKLETAKLYMYIYKESGDVEKYRDACVSYAEDDQALHKADCEAQLIDMDTAIALSIASTPDLI